MGSAPPLLVAWRPADIPTACRSSAAPSSRRSRARQDLRADRCAQSQSSGPHERFGQDAQPVSGPRAAPLAGLLNFGPRRGSGLRPADVRSAARARLGPSYYGPPDPTRTRLKTESERVRARRWPPALRDGLPGRVTRAAPGRDTAAAACLLTCRTIALRPASW
eukprot:scaffold3607_cov114-Isochrysis_galbana.AAC.13